MGGEFKLSARLEKHLHALMGREREREIWKKEPLFGIQESRFGPLFVRVNCALCF